MKPRITQKSILTFIYITILLGSCTKDETKTNEVAPQSKLRLLTANVWNYDSVYINWGTPSQSVVFASNSLSNSQNWSKSRVKFYIDGTFNEILTTGILRQGTDLWSMNSDSTILYTSGGGYSNTGQIITLTSTKLVVIDNINKVRGVQVPKY